LLVKERQRIVALHLYVRRAQQQEEDAAEAAKVALGRASVLAPRQPLDSYNPSMPPFLVPNFHQLHAHANNAAAAAAVDTAYMKADGASLLLHIQLNHLFYFLYTTAEKQRNNLLYSSLLELRSHHPVPDAALPLLLCVLNMSNSVKEASEKIESGKLFILIDGENFDSINLQD